MERFDELMASRLKVQRSLAAKRGWETRRLRSAKYRREWSGNYLTVYVEESGLLPYLEPGWLTRTIQRADGR